jgi:hypothetical protein
MIGLTEISVGRLSIFARGEDESENEHTVAFGSFDGGNAYFTIGDARRYLSPVAINRTVILNFYL